MSDQIILKGIRSDCIIGINSDEREKKQEIIINLVIFHDFSQLNDDIKNTINYSSVYKATKKFVENSKFFLIESLGNELANQLIMTFKLKGIEIEIIKPSIFNKEETVSIKLNRKWIQDKLNY